MKKSLNSQTMKVLEMSLRILFASDRMFKGTSAYSRIAYETCTRLSKMGHVIGHIPFGRTNMLGNFPMGDVLVMTSGRDPFAEDVMLTHYVDFPADLLITNIEPWAFQNLPRWAVNWSPIVPIDHSPVSVQITGKIETCFKPIAISKFGQRELSKKKIDSYYIPNGVNTSIFKPLSTKEKAEAKEAFYIDPEDFVVGVTAMNRARKMIPRMLRGYKRFLELNPDIKKSKLLLWTDIMPTKIAQEVEFGVSDVGEYLLPEIMDLGLNDVVMWPKWDEVQRIGGLLDRDPNNKWDMVRLYGASDVHMLTSGGEGAGMTYLETSAMGIPSIYTNYAAAPEYAGPIGYPVEAKDYVIMNTPGVRRYLADIDGIAEALTKVYNTDREKLVKRGVWHAAKYNWDLIMEKYWKPYLDECEKELHPKIVKGETLTWI